MQKAHLPVRAVKVPRLEGGSIEPRKESRVNWDGPIAMVPCLHQGNLYTRESRYVLSKSVLYPNLPVGGVKIPCLEGGGIGPRTESCVICDGPIAMVMRFHQKNIYTKRKLRLWREQICIQEVGAIPPLTCAGH